MKKKAIIHSLTLLFIIVTLLSSVNTAWSQAKRVAVFPFKINSKENHDYLKDGLQDMLSSRLAWEDKVEVIDNSRVNNTISTIKGFDNESLALLAGGKLKADYVVYGSLTIIGQSASLDATLADVTGKRGPLPFSRQTNDLGSVIPEINRFATQINETVFNRKVASPRPVSPETGLAGNQQSTGTGTPNPGFIARQPRSRVRNYSPNQGFIPVTSAAKSRQRHYWKSKNLDYAVRGMAAGDVNNDGITEIVTISDTAVYVYQMVNGSLNEIAKTAENRSSLYIGIDVADINNNATPEIFITSLIWDRKSVNSFVLEYANAAYGKLVKTSPWYYRVVDKVDGKTLLYGQKQDKSKEDINATPIYRMIWDGSDYIKKELLLKKGRSNLMGIAYDDILGRDENILLAFDRDDYPRLYHNPSQTIWAGSRKLGGSMGYFSGPPKDPTMDVSFQFFPMRTRTYDTNQDGIIEVIAAINHDATGSILASYRKFTKTRIEALIWDGSEMVTTWKTRTMSGQISDFFIGDFDHDGIEELVISRIYKEGSLAFTKGKSGLIAYEMMKPVKQ